MNGGRYSRFEDMAMIAALRTPWSDLSGPLPQVSPIDLGIKAGRADLDPAAGVDMIATAERRAPEHGISREQVDACVLSSHQRALPARDSGWPGEEIVAVGNERVELNGYQARGIELPRRVTEVAQDTHPRPTDAEALALDPARLNQRRGSIALGRPLAATGLRLVTTLARQLRGANLRYGIAAACIGGGQGMAPLIENPGYRA